MPAHNPKQLRNIAKMSNCSVPFDLAAMIDRFAGNPKAGKEVGLHYATYQIIDLMTKIKIKRLASLFFILLKNLCSS